jgi:hypothetical protein
LIVVLTHVQHHLLLLIPQHHNQASTRGSSKKHALQQTSRANNKCYNITGQAHSAKCVAFGWPLGSSYDRQASQPTSKRNQSKQTYSARCADHGMEDLKARVALCQPYVHPKAIQKPTSMLKLTLQSAWHWAAHRLAALSSTRHNPRHQGRPKSNTKQQL